MKNPPGLPIYSDRYTRGITLYPLPFTLYPLPFTLYPLPFTLYPFFNAFFTASTVSALESDVKLFKSPSFS